MAQRYGGKFSPDGSRPDAPPGGEGPPPRNAFDGRRRARSGGRINFLFVVPFIFLIPAFQGDPPDLLRGLLAFVLLMLVAWLTREGVTAHDAYDARRVARRPAIPRKIFASVITGAALFTGGLLSTDTLLIPIAYAVSGFALHLFAFGPDPLKDKGMEGVDSFQTDRVARAVDEAEAHLAGMKDAVLRTGDRRIEARVDRFAATARAMFRTVEADPRDLTAARKYLSVYLMGARDAAVKFADLYAQGRDPKVRADFEALLDDLETNFAARTQTLLTDNRADLNVEIEVLRERLQREG